jgi:hypothetical protein
MRFAPLAAHQTESICAKLKKMYILLISLNPVLSSLIFHFQADIKLDCLPTCANTTCLDDVRYGRLLKCFYKIFNQFPGGRTLRI